jgi:hypothetical protein
VIEFHNALAAAFAQLGATEGHMDRIEAAADMVQTPGHDVLREFVHFDPKGPTTAPGAVANIITATAVVDRTADAVGWAVGVAQYAEKITGNSVAFLTDVFVTMGEVAWISVTANSAAAEAARAKLAADPGYLTMLTATNDLFIPGPGQVAQLGRLA